MSNIFGGIITRRNLYIFLGEYFWVDCLARGGDGQTVFDLAGTGAWRGVVNTHKN